MDRLPASPKTLALGALAIVAIAFVVRPEPEPIEAGPFDPPLQEALKEPVELAAPEGYRITALDRYEVSAMLMSSKRYRFDHQARVSPVDFLLAWGPLTREPNLSGIRYSQSGRWGHTRFSFDAVNISPRVITVSSANTHIIPEVGNGPLRRRLLRARRGDIVNLEGYLVRVDGPDGWFWESSRTRRDYGDRACEIFYVTAMR